MSHQISQRQLVCVTSGGCMLLCFHFENWLEERGVFTILCHVSEATTHE